MGNLKTKDDLLAQLRSLRELTDDENIQYKNKIKNALIKCPEILYALNEKELNDELFDEDGNINWDEETHEPLGEWDRYFGSNANIRPFLFIPETQTEVKHFICYQVNCDELPRYNNAQKYITISFTVYVHEDDRIDKLTGIPRHDLIGALIKQRFYWSNIFGMHTECTYDKESTTDTHYIVRSITFQITDTNGISNTRDGKTQVNNYKVRR